MKRKLQNYIECIYILQVKLGLKQWFLYILYFSKINRYIHLNVNENAFCVERKWQELNAKVRLDDF